MKPGKNHIVLSPSDLVNFLGCRHLSALDRKVANGGLNKPTWNNPAIAILHKKGLDHEAEYLEYLRKQGKKISDLSERHSMHATIEAMKEGYDVIFQAPLSQNKWFGIADFLIKVEGKSNLGKYHYEVQDTKLSSETKAGNVLQLCYYTQIIGELQGRVPGHMTIVKPDLTDTFAFDPFQFNDFQFYHKAVKEEFEGVIAGPPKETYPVPCSRCEICRWWKDCNKKWHDDDHLSLVAGMRTSSRKTLENEGVQTLESFAHKVQPLNQRPKTGSIETYEKLHGQAKVQLKGRIEKKLIYETIVAEEKRGLNRLPEPSPGDIYFDIEGDHFYKGGSLEYLLGIVTTHTGSIKYEGFWARNRKSELEAFKKWLNSILETKAMFPDMHIYHYGHYEPTAIKHLASRHAYGEEEVDNLLREHRFVDLYATIREGLQASVESYSLKYLEQFTEYVRKADLFAASGARRKFSLALELNSLDKLDKEIEPLIELYNQDDCLATHALHQWVEEIFQKVEKEQSNITRFSSEGEEASKQVKERDQRAQELFEALTKGLDPDKTDRTQEEQARWILGHLVAYHRREERSSAWEFHHLNDQELDELFYERKAIAYMKFEQAVTEEGYTFHRYLFPEQEISLKKGDSIRAILGENIGTIHHIDKQSVLIKKNKKSDGIHPEAVIENNYINPATLENALQDVARVVISQGFKPEGPYKIAKELLLGSQPSFLSQTSGALRQPNEALIPTAIRLAKDLDKSFLAIQGPPGTGKSFTGAHMVVDLIRDKKKVGITAVSHNVIHGLHKKILEIAEEEGFEIECVHKSSKGEEVEGLSYQGDNSRAIKALDDYKVVGGTAFLWAREEAIDTMDYLFIDEAGQMSLAYVLAIARSAKNLVLLGDPQQLEQPQKGAHPEGADVSALEHILKGEKTIPDDRGLFLDTSWRLNPDICQFTSEIYYEGRLSPKEETTKQKLHSDSRFKGSGLYYVPVPHEGNRNSSDEEVTVIHAIVDELLNSHSTWVNRKGEKLPLRAEHILIVAPYNAQVNALKERLPDIKVGTVDKFQGMEAPVVIYSMASSSPEEAPRGMDFLYDPNRLNVATSRAQCISILVASPNLMLPECRTVEHMKWANGLCRYREISISQGRNEVS